MAELHRQALCDKCGKPMTAGPKPSLEFEMPTMVCEPCDAITAPSTVVSVGISTEEAT